MFTFNLKNKVPWYYGRFFKNEESILWKITIAGPFVTLYSNKEYAPLISPFFRKYRFISPFDPEHNAAHGENILEAIYPSKLRDEHSHISLPCERDLIEELQELLECIAQKNDSNKKLIDVDLIEQCIQAYGTYLSTAAQEEHRNNAMNLMLKWTSCPVEYLGWASFRKRGGNEIQGYQEITCEDRKALFTAVTKYLEEPGRETYSDLIQSPCNFFVRLNDSSQENKNEIINDIYQYLPKPSTFLFNEFITENLVPVSMGLLAVGFSGVLLLNSLGLEKVSFFYTVALMLCVPKLTEKAYTTVSNWVNPEDSSMQLSLR